MTTQKLLRSSSKALLTFLSLTIGFALQSCNKKSSNPVSSTDSNWPDRTIDLNGDGKTDYTFSYVAETPKSYPPSTAYMGLYVVSLDSNEAQRSDSGITSPLSQGTNISDSSGWQPSSESLAGSTGGGWSGPWVGTTPHYLALRLCRDGQYHYGWVELVVHSNGNLAVIDSAYDTTANEPIVAGVHP